MDEACNLRIQRLELDVTKHEEAIKEQGDMLAKIVQLVAQIRWMAMGALGFWVLQNVGLLAVIRKLMGV